MNYPKADLAKRCVAALIDAAVCCILIWIIPFLGWLVAAAYALVKDALVFELTKDAKWKNRSIGKKLMGLQVANLGGGDVNMLLSAKRNITLAIGSIIAVVPFVGLVIGGPIGGVLALIEVLLVLTDPGGRRLGDKFANTQVVLAEEAQAAAKP